MNINKNKISEKLNDEIGISKIFCKKVTDEILNIFTSKSGLSNGAIPLFLSLIPYFLAIFIKERKFFYSKIDFLIPISLLIFTAGGGMEQTGRYVMYSMSLWLPIFSQQLLFFLKKKYDA